MSIFGDLKAKATRKLIASQLKKSGANGPQQQMILKLIEDNPEVFDRMMKDLQDKMKSGMGQNAAMMMVMKKYQGELRSAAMKSQKKS